jgi:GNAT superfamily N-acetyltransferase
MSILERNVLVSMERDSLDELPHWPLPAEFSAQWYRPGDEQKWVDIHLLAERHVEISPQVYRHEFGTDAHPLAQRQLFLYDDCRTPVATATAWWDDDYFGHRCGRVHWVAVVPEHRGRGLAKPLLSLVLERLRHLGHKLAYLRTSTARVSAINLYLKCGFHPAVCTPEDELAWTQLRPYLKYRADWQIRPNG